MWTRKTDPELGRMSKNTERSVENCVCDFFKTNF